MSSAALSKICSSSSSRAAISLAKATSSTRPLSAQCVNSVDRLRKVFGDHKRQNFANELPSRVTKEICKVASNNNQMIAPEGTQRVLSNTGASNLLSNSELKWIFEELGEECGSIPSQIMMQIL